MSVEQEPAPGSPLTAHRSSLRFCRRLTRRANSSFPVAFRLLPPAKRDATTALYAFLRTEQARAGARCGFVHLPYLPQQVAALLADLRKEQRLELHQRADLASMSLEAMVEAVRIVLAVSLG